MFEMLKYYGFRCSYFILPFMQHPVDMKGCQQCKDKNQQAVWLEKILKATVKTLRRLIDISSRLTLLTRTPRPRQCHQNGVSSPWWRVPRPVSSSPWCGWSRRSSDPGDASTGLKWSSHYIVLTVSIYSLPVSENTGCVQLGSGRLILFSQDKSSQIKPKLIKVHISSKIYKWLNITYLQISSSDSPVWFDTYSKSSWLSAYNFCISSPSFRAFKSSRYLQEHMYHEKYIFNEDQTIMVTWDKISTKCFLLDQYVHIPQLILLKWGFALF